MKPSLFSRLILLAARCSLMMMMNMTKMMKMMKRRSTDLHEALALQPALPIGRSVQPDDDDEHDEDDEDDEEEEY
ncbi:hypothetical protein NQZ68_021911 [Dissostichus eleginoides]|nr:hypothetical protein NQZ68_021911 [Dissostichus eleginoides]